MKTQKLPFKIYELSDIEGPDKEGILKIILSDNSILYTHKDNVLVNDLSTHIAVKH